jgi:hypothetical protein
MTVLPCLARPPSRPITEAAMKESRPLVGSSQNRSGGSVRTYRGNLLTVNILLSKFKLYVT